MNDILQVRRATTADLPVILGMIDEAAAWLRTKDTDQWAKPWPNKAARDARVGLGIRDGNTWIAEEHGKPVATVTYRQHGNQALWSPGEQREPAVYVSRLIAARHAAGLGIGAAMIDWAAQRGVQEWSARWVRIDVWTTNLALHNYYEKRGFGLVRINNAQKTYPSAALFQKRTSEIDEAAAARFADAACGSARPDQAQPTPPQRPPGPQACA